MVIDKYDARALLDPTVREKLVSEAATYRNSSKIDENEDTADFERYLDWFVLRSVALGERGKHCSISTLLINT